MKKIVLVEDRVERQGKFTTDLGFDLNNLDNLTNICGGEAYDEFKNKIFQGTAFDKYDIIMIHRSALSTEEQSRLTEVIRNQPKTLILFSGGISSISLKEFGKNKGQLLTINVKDFYRKSLLSFINTPDPNIQQLAFGDNWKVNIQATLLEKLSYYLEGYIADTPYVKVISDLNLTDEQKEIYFPNKGSQEKISKKDLEMMRDTIAEYLSEVI